MRRIMLFSTMFLVVILLSSCVFAPVVPPRGVLYNDQRSPLFPGGRPGSKEGKASSYSVLFLVGWGNSGLAEAMKNGDIKEVRHTDYRMVNYLLFYQRYTTIVYGE